MVKFIITLKLFIIAWEHHTHWCCWCPWMQTIIWRVLILSLNYLQWSEPLMQPEFQYLIYVLLFNCKIRHYFGFSPSLTLKFRESVTQHFKWYQTNKTRTLFFWISSVTSANSNLEHLWLLTYLKCFTRCRLSVHFQTIHSYFECQVMISGIFL